MAAIDGKGKAMTQEGGSQSKVSADTPAGQRGAQWIGLKKPMPNQGSIRNDLPRDKKTG